MKSTRHTKRGIQARRLDPELLEELKKAMGTIDTAINRFEQVVDPTLIDCYIAINSFSGALKSRRQITV